MTPADWKSLLDADHSQARPLPAPSPTNRSEVSTETTLSRLATFKCVHDRFVADVCPTAQSIANKSTSAERGFFSKAPENFASKASLPWNAVRCVCYTPVALTVWFPVFAARRFTVLPPTRHRHPLLTRTELRLGRKSIWDRAPALGVANGVAQRGSPAPNPVTVPQAADVAAPALRGRPFTVSAL